MKKEVIGKGEIVKFISEITGVGMTQTAAKELVDNLGLYLLGSIHEGKVVRFPYLGILSLQETAARVCRNPLTGEKIDVPNKKRIRFRMSTSAKLFVNTTSE